VATVSPVVSGAPDEEGLRGTRCYVEIRRAYLAWSMTIAEQPA